jgi:threonine dehydratase
MPRQYLERILRSRVYDVARETPLERVPILSDRLANKVLLKREDLQPVFSFKIRGAYNKIVMLSPAQRARGVIAVSAGNHAQGVALAAQHLGVDALIVMPKTAPRIKVNATRRFGAEIVLHGNFFDEAKQHAEEIIASRGMVLIPPYDDVDVIAGQGTVAMEILRQHGEHIHAIFIPVGGGGLIAGMSAYIKSLWPQIKVIGVEPEDAPTLHHALRAGAPVDLEQVGIFADGVAVKRIGDEPFRIANQCVDEVILVSTDEICAAIKDIFDDTRSIAEPSGALSVAGLKRFVEREGIQNETLVAIDSGANVNFDRLRHIAERAEIGEHREALLAVTIPERPGSFRQFCQAIGQRSVTEFNYRYAHQGDAHIFVGVELSDEAGDRELLTAHLREQGYPVIDLTDNELAKVHIRHMVGGRAPGTETEALYRFEFPERPGALLGFLTRMGEDWNISMFHYRNHGSAYGRVLVGMQVPDVDRAAFTEFLSELGYRYEDETDNPAYRLFLSA